MEKCNGSSVSDSLTAFIGTGSCLFLDLATPAFGRATLLPGRVSYLVVAARQEPRPAIIQKADSESKRQGQGCAGLHAQRLAVVGGDGNVGKQVPGDLVGIGK